MRRAALACVSLAALAGCATPTNWINPFITDVAARDRQMVIDNGYCTRAASGAVPIPQVRVYTAGQTNYTVQGTARYGSTTSSYNARVNASPSPGAAFAQGFANGMNIGAAARAQAEKRQVYDGCMVALGWARSEAEAANMRAQQVREKQEAADDVQIVIDTIPELASWQNADPRRWALAVAFDKELMANPSYRHVSSRDRFLEVVRRVREAAPE